ncbi:YtpI family protein [Oceanobacillus kapialis]|uniref:YtpI family protein n=1 Tax=Oceanobacillus kapialis TaxID=481353 RepID=A0ABW5PXG5_9BACI
MFIFPIIIILSVVFYVYYKVAILKTKDRLTQVYFNARSRMCLGSFLLFFGVNQYVFYQTQLALFIGILFFAWGAYLLYFGFKEAKHYKNEYKRLHPAGYKADE